MKKFLLFTLSFTSYLMGFSQLANDNCTNAQAIQIPNSGTICITSTNAGATSDAATNTCDVGAAGNEVWFKYIAAGPVNSVSVQPIGSTPASSLVVTLISTGCASNVYDMCSSATAGATATAATAFSVGTEVLISVETNGTDGGFELCISSTSPPPTPGNTCPLASLLCTKSDFSLSTLSGFTSSGLNTLCGNTVRQDAWIKFTVGVTGTMEFFAQPNGTAEFDWAVYDVTGGCPGGTPTAAQEVACNYYYSNGNTIEFGMISTITANTGEYSPSITLVAGNTYALMIDNYSLNSTGFSLQWGGTFEMGTTADFIVNPTTSCTVPLTVNITNNSIGASSYVWNFGDGTSSTSANPGTHTYNVFGDYLISLTATNTNGCSDLMVKRVNLNAGPVVSIAPPAPTICPGGSVQLTGTLALGRPAGPVTFYNETRYPIPNNSTTGTNSIINVSNINPTTLASGMVLEICVTLKHTRHADIKYLSVTSPSGQIVYFVNNATLPTGNGTITYCYTAAQNNSFTGGNTNGNWTLNVQDNVATTGFPFSTTNIGSVISWKITLQHTNVITGYTWSPTTNMTNSTTLTPTVSPTTTTTYTLSATDANGCSGSKAVVITVNPLVPPAVASSNNITCSSPSATLTGTSAGNTMVWNGGSLTNAANPATVTAAGTYTVTATNATGCTSTATITITGNTTPPVVTATSNNNIGCISTSAILTGTSAGNTMVWNGGSLTNAANPATVTAAGTYTVTATSAANGCTATTTVTVTSNTTPPNAVGGAPLALDCTTTSGAITVSSSTPGATYNWSGPSIISGGTNASATVNAAGTYTATVTNPANGCTNTATVNVTVTGVLPNVSTGPSLALNCITTSGNITASSTTSDVSYSWAGPGITAGETTSTATVNAAGTYTVTVTNTSTGCLSTANVIVTSNTTPPTVTAASSNNISCTSTSAILTGTSAGNTMVWNGGALSNAANPATVTATGTYTVTATDGANSCTATTTVTVTSNTTPPGVTASGSNISCTSTTSTLSGTSTGNTMVWNGGTLSNAANPATVTAAGTYTVTATSAANGCTATTTVTVTSNTTPPVVAAASSNNISCTTTSATLTGTSAGNIIKWNGGTLSNAANPATVTASGTYTVTATNTANGCTTTSTVTVISDTISPNANAGAAQSLTCTNSSVLLTGTSSTTGVNYNWSGPGSITANTDTLTAYAAGTYTLTVTNSTNGCDANSFVTVSPIIPITAYAGDDVTIQLGASTTIGAIGGTTYTWSPSTNLSCSNCDTTIASPTHTTTYCVMVRDGSCISSDCVTVNVERPCKFNVPNAFSPNNDGNNDEYCLQDWNFCVSRFNIYIFDRWGEKVYESTDGGFCWDGVFRGKSLDPGVYVFIINAIGSNGDTIEKKGNISLIR